MAFYDGFFDWLADAFGEYQSNKRTRDRRRYSDPGGSGYRYRSGSQRAGVHSDGEGDLRRYEGLYNRVRERGDDSSDGQQALRDYGRRIGSERDPYGDGYERPRGMSPRRRRETALRERERLSGAQRPGHIYDDVADRLDSEDEEYIMPTFGIGKRLESERMQRRERMDGRYDRRMPDARGYAGDRRGGRYDGRPPIREYDRRREYEPPMPQKKRMSIGARLAIIAVITIFLAVQAVILGSVTSKPRQPQEEIPEVDYSGSTVNSELVSGNTDAMYAQQAEQIVEAMSVEERVGQLIIAVSGGASDESFCSIVSATDAAGVLLRPDDVSGRSADGLKKFITDLQREGGGELLVMVEEEGGAKVTVSANSRLRTEGFRSAQAMYVSGGLELIKQDAADKSTFLKELGINVNIAPTCDVVTSTGGFMYPRAFGHGAADTSEYVKTVTTEMEKAGMGCVLKYFPGYGNSTGDTRNGLVVISTVGTVLRERDMLPFDAGIKAGADAVMVSHAIVTELDNNAPASMSAEVIGLLRDEMGFDGVVMCEDLDDEGLAEYSGNEDMSVTALNAGVDLLLAPADAPATRSSIIEAVYNGIIDQERLSEAARRVVFWKLKMGLIAADG